MNKRDLAESLQDIVAAISAIERFMAEVEFEELAQNEEKIFAVVKAIEIIGEAVKNVPDSIRSNYPEIPWKRISNSKFFLQNSKLGKPLRIRILADRPMQFKCATA